MVKFCRLLSQVALGCTITLMSSAPLHPALQNANCPILCIHNNPNSALLPPYNIHLAEGGGIGLD